MKKRVNLYLDEELVLLATQRKLNISEFVNDRLAESFGLEKKWVNKK